MPAPKEPSFLKKWLFICLGVIFFILGMAGIILPFLPGLLFTVLSLACFAKGSEKIHFWLTNNPWFGKYFKNMEERKGVPLWSKIATVIFIFLSASFGIIFVAKTTLIRIISGLVSLTMIIIILKQPTLKK